MCKDVYERFPDCECLIRHATETCGAEPGTPGPNCPPHRQEAFFWSKKPLCRYHHYYRPAFQRPNWLTGWMTGRNTWRFISTARTRRFAPDPTPEPEEEEWVPPPRRSKKRKLPADSD